MRNHVLFVLGIVLITLCAARTAHAEPCEPEWVSLGESGTMHTIQSLTKWDPDGPGPAPESIIAGGTFGLILTDFNGAARWTGSRWEALGPGPGMEVGVVATWDPDGDGPSADLLIAGGTDGLVKTYDGATWTSLGTFTGTSALIKATISWDADGPGPGSPVLLIGGWFTGVNGQPLTHIAAWDGQSWTALGASDPGGINALTTWDADNDPQTPNVLLAGGSHISIFDGTAWSHLDGTDDDYAYAITTWDRDGDGPDGVVACAAGTFQFQSTAPINGIALWNGATWEHLAPAPPVNTLGPINNVNELVAGDPDGPGPAPHGLTMVSTFGGQECFFWDGTRWLDYSVSFDARLNAAIIGDPDGDGPAGDHLIIDGGGNPSPPSYRDEFGWQPLGSPLGRVLHKLALWDPDGSGPKPETVFAGGAIFGGTLQGVAELKDGRWGKLGAGPAPYASPYNNYSTFHLHPWRDGPSPHDGGVLVAIGEYVPPSLGLPSNSIPVWNGAAWSSIPAPPTPGVTRVATWDVDGLGPVPESLVIANGGVYAHDGTAWTSLSTAAYPVKSIAIVWDPDGNGPETPRLISSNASVGFVWRTTGEWNPMPASFADTTNYSLSAQDPDGDGPEPEWLIAMRDADDEQTSTYEYRIERWNGAEWSTLTTPFIASSLYSFVTILDRDSAGPGAPAVVVGRYVGFLGETTSRDLLIFENGVWTDLASFDTETYAYGTPWTAMPISRAIPGFPGGSLFLGGRFEGVDSVISLNTAALRACPPQPCPGDINADGATNVWDFNLFATNFGEGPGATRAQGDLTGDGFVDVWDFNVFAGDLGCVTP